MAVFPCISVGPGHNGFIGTAGSLPGLASPDASALDSPTMRGRHILLGVKAVEPLEPSDEFQITYPCYLLFAKSSFIFDESGRVRGWSDRVAFVGIEETDSGDYILPVFTDEDLSRQFIANAGLENVACVFAKDPEGFRTYLEDARTKFSFVVFDPDKPKGWTKRNWPIDYVIKQVKDGKGLR